MSIASEIERIKGNIASAYGKAEEKGAVLPSVRNSAGLAGVIESIPQGVSEEDWRPEADWWDIERILEEDKEDYEGKMICLLKDCVDSMVLPESYSNIMGAVKIRTSDGAEYTDLRNGITHVWDKEKDKVCGLGYKTRYVIFYWSGRANFGVWGFENIFNVLYMICKGMEMMSSNSGYQFPQLKMCECVKFYDCVYLSGAFRLMMPKLRHVLFENVRMDMTEYLDNLMDSKYLSEAMIKRVYDVAATGNEVSYSQTFRNCMNLREIGLKSTKGVSNFSRMFSNCYNLKRVTGLDLGACVNGSNMFENCEALEELEGSLDLSSCTNSSNMFLNCSSLMSVGELNLGNSTSCVNMFGACSSLVDMGNLDLSSCTDCGNMFSACYGLVCVGELSTGSVKNFSRMFSDCKSLKRIGGLDFRSCTNCTNMFDLCKRLEDIGSVLNIGISGLSFVHCSLLNQDTLVRILDGLYDYSADGGTHTITLGATNLAKLSEEEIAIGQNKGWTIS